MYSTFRLRGNSRFHVVLTWNKRGVFRTLPNIYHETCDALRDLEPFLQFKKREKQPWRSVNFGKVADFL